MVTENLPTVGALARFEAKPGNEADVERFFQEGLLIVQRQPASIAWYAFRLGPTTFGAFAAFANEEERSSLGGEKFRVVRTATYLREGRYPCGQASWVELHRGKRRRLS
jgi:hypothetical protein